MLDERIRRHLMEAEPAELRGEGDSALARLVRTDMEVRAVAEGLLRGMNELDGVLAAFATERQPLGVIPAAPRRVARATWWKGIGLATGLAAATLGALLLSTPEVQPPPGQIESAPLTATLDVESSRRFAVFATNNPDIAIVWLFDEEER